MKSLRIIGRCRSGRVLLLSLSFLFRVHLLRIDFVELHDSKSNVQGQKVGMPLWVLLELKSASPISEKGIVRGHRTFLRRRNRISRIAATKDTSPMMNGISCPVVPIV